MANIDNECSGLEINDLHASSKDTLGDCFNHQKEMQEKTYSYDFSNLTIGEIVDFCFMNKHALEDEISEFFDALGGVKDGGGNAAWKPWKKENSHIRQLKISDLSDNDLKELKMEYVDMFHFFLNFGAVIGMTPKELYNYYMSKAQENKDRQKRGY